MKKSYKYLVILLAGMALVLNSCKEDCPCTDDPTNPDCENYDPCWGKQPVTAAFEMGRYKGGGDPDYVPDWHPETAFERGGVIGFKALGYDKSDTSIKYTWLLGSETIYGYEFNRDFVDIRNTDIREIKITLIVEGLPNLDCFPEDDGKDTLVKYIQFLDGPCEFLIMGDFKVLFDGYQDSVIVSTRAWDNIQSSERPAPITDSCSSFRIIYIGFDPQKTYSDTNWRFQNVYYYNSKAFYGNVTARAILGNGSFEVDPNTLVAKAEYTFGLGGDEFLTYKFKGRKIK
jgi:hypothetical protein